MGYMKKAVKAKKYSANLINIVLPLAYTIFMKSPTARRRKINDVFEMENIKNGKYISSLTALRGIAALLVIIFHFDLIFFRLAASDTPFFIRNGYLWVDFFFILSGFIMMHVYGESFSGKFNIQVFKKYMRARFARIYPLHIFSFLSVVVFYFWYFSHNKLNAMDVCIFNAKAIYANTFFYIQWVLTNI